MKNFIALLPDAQTMKSSQIFNFGLMLFETDDFLSGGKGLLYSQSENDLFESTKFWLVQSHM